MRLRDFLSKIGVACNAPFLGHEITNKMAEYRTFLKLDRDFEVNSGSCELFYEIDSLEFDDENKRCVMSIRYLPEG